MTLLTESRSDTIVMAFGRLNPVTSGHELLVRAVVALAKKHNADHVVFLSRSQDKQKNPLTVDQKVYYAKQSFNGVNFVGASDKIRTFIEAAASLTGKYKNLIMVAGSDRILDFKQKLDRYNGSAFKFDSILVVSAGERDPDADGASGMSASKMRQAAADNLFRKFYQGVPSGMSMETARKMFQDVRAGMQIKENSNDLRESFITGKIFNIGDTVLYKGNTHEIVSRGPNYVMLEDKTMAWITDLTPTMDESMKVTHQDRLKAARIIGMSLGYLDSDTKTDPTGIVNSALRGIRNKQLNPESKNIIGRMLDLAKNMDIQYDVKLIDLGAAPAHTSPEEKVRHNLLAHNPSDQTEYSRKRKIHLKVHESEEEDEFDEDEIEELLNSISDDDVIEHGYDDEEFHLVDDETGEVIESFELEQEPLLEVLSRIERMRAKVRMKRSEQKRERGLRIALKRRSSGAVIAKRARRVAINTLKTKLARKPLKDLSVVEKERLEARIAKMKPVVTRIASKMLQRVRTVEKSRLEHASTAKE